MRGTGRLGGGDGTARWRVTPCDGQRGAISKVPSPTPPAGNHAGARHKGGKAIFSCQRLRTLISVDDDDD